MAKKRKMTDEEWELAKANFAGHRMHPDDQAELDRCEEVMHMYDNDWFRAYVNLGGVSPRETFLVQVDVFFDLTSAAYIGGVGSRQEAWAEWAQHIGDDEEAKRYFVAIDSVTPYT